MAKPGVRLHSCGLAPASEIIGRETSPARLAEAFKNSEPCVRSAAAARISAMARAEFIIRTPASSDAPAQCLPKPPSAKRSALLRTLGIMLEHPDRAVQETAVQSLSLVGKRGASLAARRLGPRQDPYVLKAAIRVLQQMSIDSVAVSHIGKLMDLRDSHSDLTIRYLAGSAINCIRNAGCPPRPGTAGSSVYFGRGGRP